MYIEVRRVIYLVVFRVRVVVLPRQPLLSRLPLNSWMFFTHTTVVSNPCSTTGVVTLTGRQGMAEDVGLLCTRE